MDTAQDVEKYWQEKSAELGEPIVQRSISHTFLPDLPDTFGILFASEGTLVYEYSKGGRKSILDVILSRKKDEELSESVRIRRDEIQRVAIVDACTAKGWLRRQHSASQILDQLQQQRPSPLRNLLCGAYLVVASRRLCMICDTPENRAWLSLLRAGK
jgi:hypothetical protein